MSAFTACSKYEVKPYLCHTPQPPVYMELDRNEHIASSKNMELLMILLSDMTAYIEKLEASIKCFEDGKRDD